ncbi:minor capsid protein [Gracilibacillus thailandensis]|uniref:Minor capsid protein n=1 Tax=Gracilibacillus thailandensis TaxID=563735 RepID=A0A6N7QW21_9BACI|nr:minor capsid protein [Gracilibacillus thailandensis]MRI65161.1 minor capsid protein [Gracilibacillus thailandensis]
MLNFKVEWFNIDKRIDQATMLSQKFLDGEVLKDSNFYVPADEWNLRDSSIAHSKIGSGELNWVTPYSRRLYYNPQYDFSTDKNPNAQGLWFEVAKAQDLDNWIKGSEKAFRSGF